MLPAAAAASSKSKAINPVRAHFSMPLVLSRRVYSFSEIGSCAGRRLNKLQTSLSSADGWFAENE
jgi:predicted metal-binding protein